MVESQPVKMLKSADSLITHMTESSASSGSQNISFRGVSFRLSDTERNSLSSNLKKQLCSLTSQETLITDKIKTVTAVLKAVGKPVKSEKLINLMEKKAQPNELKVVLQKFEHSQYSTLMEYLFWFSKDNVRTTRESGTCLLDIPCLQSTSNNRREKVDACLSQVQTVVGICFARAMSVHVYDTLQTLGSLTPPTEIERIGDHIQLLADLYLFLVDEAPHALRKDFIDIMIFFAKDALENIDKVVLSDPKLRRSNNQQASAQTTLKIRLIERVIHACLTVSASFQEIALFGPQKRVLVIDGEVLLWASNLIKATLNLIEPLEFIFKGEQQMANIETRHVLFNRKFPSKLIKTLNDDTEVEMRHDNSSLFCMAMLVANKSTECIFKYPEKLAFRTDHSNFVLKVADRAIITQIEVYLAAERHGIETAPKSEAEEEIKFQDVGAAAQEDEKVDVDDFVKDQIAGSGLLSQEVYNSQVSQSSQGNNRDQIEHTSTRLLSDERISADNCKVSSKGLARSTQMQDDWLRVNFTLFRLIERILTQENTGRGPERTRPKDFKLGHLFDLYKIQLYFLMLVHRLAMYIEVNTVEFFGIDFLSEMPLKTEKGEFNCPLSHTLARMFNFMKVCRDMTLLTQVQGEIIQILTQIRSYQFDPVDQPHYLKVFFLLFLNRMTILPIETQVPSGQLSEIETVKKMRKELFVSLYMLYKIDSFAEKFLPITEDIFDTDSILVIRSLIQIWHQEEVKRRATATQAVSQVVRQVNSILVQRQAFLNLAKLAGADGEINKRCIDAIRIDMRGVFKQHGKPDGDLYVDQEVTIEMPHHLPPVTAIEYKCTGDVYSSRLYMLLKLAIALISSNPAHLESDKAFHILYQSTDAESHYTSQHSSTNNRTMIPADKNQSFPGTVREPVGRDSRGYVSVQGSLSRRNCDDCLKCQFKQFVPNKSFNALNLLQLLNGALTQIHMFTEILQKQALLERQALNQNVITANMQNNLLDKLNMVHQSDHCKQLYGKNQTYLSKNVDDARRRAQPSTGFKIMEKINQMVQRFVVFVLQCKPIANLFCKIAQKSLESEHKDGILLFKSIKDEVFLLLALRNLTFNTDVNSNSAETIWPIKTMINNTIKQIKTQWTAFQSTEQATNKFIKEMQQLSTLSTQPTPHLRMQKMRSQMAVGNSKAQQKNLQLTSKSRLSRGGNSPVLSTKDIIAKHQEISEKSRATFKKQAEIAVSILSIYLANIAKHKKSSLLLFERRFIFELFQVLKSIIIQEGSYSLDLNDELLNAFLFEKVEVSDPLRLELLEMPIMALRYTPNFNTEKLFHSSVEFFQKLLSFLIQSLTEQIKTAKGADLTHPGQEISIMIQMKQTLNTIISRLHMKIVEPENTSVTLLKFARSLNRDCLSLFKKIYIFLREQISENENDGLEMRGTIVKLNEIFACTFSRVPQAMVFRDFFSFLRDIFFYQKQMDLTDLALAQDLMSVLHDTISMNSRHALSQSYYSNQNSVLHMQDSFFFSKMSPGALVLNELPISTREELYMTVLFKIHSDQIQEDLDIINKEKQQESAINDIQCTVQRMILCSFQLCKDPKVDGTRCFDVEIKVDMQRRVFSLSLRLRLNEKTVTKDLPREIPLDAKWNFLLIHFSKKHTIELILKGGDEAYQMEEIALKDFIPEKNNNFQMALGNQVSSVFANNMEARDDFSQPGSRPNRNHKQLYFRGMCSLPYFFKGVSEFKKLMKSQKPGTQSAMSDTMSQSRRSGLDSASFLHVEARGQTKSDSTDYMNVFIEVLIDLIINRKLLGLTELSLLNKIMKSQDKRTMALEQVKQGFNAQGLKQDLSNKRYTITDFLTADNINSQVIHVHSLLVQLGSISAVKAYRAVEVFENLGGFKNMYPLVQNIVKSNLKDDFGAARCGVLLGKVFQVLETLLLERPEHIQTIMNQRNMFGLLRHCLTLLGKEGLLSSKVLDRLTSVVTNNILAQWQYRKTKTRTVETVTESTDGQPGSRIMEEETLFELSRKVEYNLKHVKDNKLFYTQFLSSFTHSVLLDKQFLMHTYARSSDLPSDDSSSQEQQFGSIKSGRRVLQKIVDMMHSICCPLSLKKSIMTKKRVTLPDKQATTFENDGDTSSNSFMLDGINNTKSQISAANECPSIDGIFTNFVELRSFVVTEKTITQLRDLFECKNILDEQYATTLSKISQCIASAMIYTSNEKQMRQVLHYVLNDTIKIPQMKMKVHLQIILSVLDTHISEKDGDKQKTMKVMSVIRELKLEQFVRSILRYQDDVGNYSYFQVDQIIKLADSIIHLASHRKLIKPAMKQTYEDLKRDHYRAYSDSNDSHLGRAFDDMSSSSGLSRHGAPMSTRNKNRQTANMTVYEETKNNQLLKSLKQPAFGQMLSAADSFDDPTMRRPSVRKFSNGPGFMRRPDLSGQNFQPDSIRIDSVMSNAGDEDNDLNQITMDNLYAKSTFKKVVKRLTEDSSSIWYDHQEQEMLEFDEICENYEKLKQNCDGMTIEHQQKIVIDDLLRQSDPETRKLIEYRYKERKSHFDDIVENPSSLVPSYNLSIPHQKLGFVTQRRVVDKWGRMMLLMPNRKYFKQESRMFYDYHVYDYLDKMFALSLLKDEDYDDLVIPANQYKDLLDQKMNQRRNRSASPTINNPSAANVPATDGDDGGDLRVEIIQDEEYFNTQKVSDDSF